LAEEEISAEMSLFPRGRLWPGVVRWLLSLSRNLWARDQLPRARDWAQTLSRRGTTALPKLREGVGRRFRRLAWERAPKVSASHLLAALGRKPRWLLGDYATKVRVDPRARGFYHDRGRNVVWGYSIGFDLIPTATGVWCVEANPNTGAYRAFEEGDYGQEGAIERIFLAAKEWGFGTVWWENVDWHAISPWQMETFTEKARTTCLSLITGEDFRVPPAPNLPKETLPPRKQRTFHQGDRLGPPGGRRSAVSGARNDTAPAGVAAPSG
jgi:hypothetical protein